MKLYYIIGALFVLFACQKAEKKVNTISSLNIRIAEEPDRLHPILSNTGTADRIEQKIFLPLLGIDVEDYTPVPVLVENLPEIDQNPNQKTIYTFQLRPEAQWENGKSITAKDISFTIKASFIPGLQNSWQAYLNHIDSVILYPEDRLKFSFVLNKDYILNEAALGSIQPYPEYHYDTAGVLQNYTLSELKSLDSLPPDLSIFKKDFSSAAFSRRAIVGSGPYKLDRWEAQKGILLRRIENHWTNDMNPKPIECVAKPKSISYLIVPDETTAINMLKSGNLDAINQISPDHLDKLKGDSLVSTASINTFKQYYILLNTKDLVLKHHEVRYALAHLVNRDYLIQETLNGLGIASFSPIHPSKIGFDNSIDYRKFDPSKAKSILTKADWKDSDGDGILDKMINGKNTDLSLELLITGKALGKSIALKLQEQARALGIKINIRQMNIRDIISKLRQGDYQMTPLSLSTSPFPDDPYQSWHTDNFLKGNYTGFGTTASDSIIVALRTAERAIDQLDKYHAFQKVFHEEQPAIFLATPLQPLAFRSTFDFKLSSINGGVIEQTATYVE